MTDELRKETERLLSIQPDGVQSRHIRALQSELDRLRQQLAERGEPTYVSLAIATAPERIRLQISDDEEHYGEPFPGEHSAEVTWCSEPTLACEVPYVRADLAAPPAQSAALVPCSVCGGDGMKLNYAGEPDECPRCKGNTVEPAQSAVPQDDAECIVRDAIDSATMGGTSRTVCDKTFLRRLRERGYWLSAAPSAGEAQPPSGWRSVIERARHSPGAGDGPDRKEASREAEIVSSYTDAIESGLEELEAQGEIEPKRCAGCGRSLAPHMPLYCVSCLHSGPPEAQPGAGPFNFEQYMVTPDRIVILEDDGVALEWQRSGEYIEAEICPGDETDAPRIEWMRRDKQGSYRHEYKHPRGSVEEWEWEDAAINAAQREADRIMGGHYYLSDAEIITILNAAIDAQRGVK